MTRTIGGATKRGCALRGRALWLAAVVLGLTGCSLDGLLNSDQVPNNITDPALTKTPKGALAVYSGVLVLLREAFGGTTDGTVSVFVTSFIVQSGLLSDEFTLSSSAFSINNYVANLRRLPQGGYNVFEPTAGGGAPYTYSVNSSTYEILQKARGQAAQAIGLLTDYADPAQPELVSHAYALQAYTEIFLAELYCSGVPLSTLDYNGDYTLKPGSRTAELFTHAVALFDTALALAGDSARFRDLAAVGKGRALLGLDSIQAAAAAVAAVPDDYRYQVTYAASDKSRNFAFHLSDNPTSTYPAVADREGTHGLDYVSSQDPRTPTVLVTPATGPAYYVPAPTLYAADGGSPIVLASGVEARLIEAEAALRANDAATWLTTLNTLRATVGLADTADPGTADARVDLLFRERAFWLFATGHRQGDLRRLIRQYGRSQDQTYPTGAFTGGRTYGTDVNFPLPQEELRSNPLVTGCLSREA